MRYQITPIFCRPWLLNGLSIRLMESRYEINYGGALRRLNAIIEKLSRSTSQALQMPAGRDKFSHRQQFGLGAALTIVQSTAA
jgi:hypothetical protein